MTITCVLAAWLSALQAFHIHCAQSDFEAILHSYAFLAAHGTMFVVE
jgi:hypothetical protein